VGEARFLGGTVVQKLLVCGAALLIVLVVSALLPRLVLVPRVSSELEQFIADEFHAQKVAVDLPGGGGWSLLVGLIPAISIELEDGTVNGFPVTEAVLFAEGVRFHPWTLFREREFSYGGSDLLRISARVSAESLSEYFRQHVPQIPDLVVEVDHSQLQFSGTIDLLGVPWHLALGVAVETADQTVLRFVPVALRLEQAAVPPALVDLLQEYFRLEVDLDQFPFPIRIAAAEVEAGGIALVVEEIVE
jgi:hypothetical protein